MADKFEFPVDRTAIMLFARALGDISPVYSDPAHSDTKAAGGVVAPPTFVQASAHWDPDYPLDLTRPRTTPLPPARGDVGRLLHGEQRYEYHHPVYAGDTLTVTTKPGKTWEKAGKRGGMMKFAESVTEYRNQDGVLCVTATSVGIETEHTVEQSG